MLDDIIKGITNFFFDMLMGSTKSFLDMITELFQKSVDTVQTNVSETPTEFSQTIVDNLRIISDTAILPVAGLILTYVFCYELYQLVVEKNRGGDFETGQLMFLIIKTSAMILLLTNAFDLGKWITNHVPASALKIPDSIKENIVGSIEEGDVGSAMSMWFVIHLPRSKALVNNKIIALVLMIKNINCPVSKSPPRFFSTTS